MRNLASFVFQVENDLVGHGLVELVGVDIAPEDVTRHLLVFLQQRRAGEADKDGMAEPALHLLVHVPALGAVTLIDKDVELAVDRRCRALQVGGVEFVDERAEQARQR